MQRNNSTNKLGYPAFDQLVSPAVMEVEEEDLIQLSPVIQATSLPLKENNVPPSIEQSMRNALEKFRTQSKRNLIQPKPQRKVSAFGDLPDLSQPQRVRSGFDGLPDLSVHEPSSGPLTAFSARESKATHSPSPEAIIGIIDDGGQAYLSETLRLQRLRDELSLLDLNNEEGEQINGCCGNGSHGTHLAPFGSVPTSTGPTRSSSPRPKERRSMKEMYQIGRQLDASISPSASRTLSPAFSESKPLSIPPATFLPKLTNGHSSTWPTTSRSFDEKRTFIPKAPHEAYYHERSLSDEENRLLNEIKLRQSSDFSQIKELKAKAKHAEKIAASYKEQLEQTRQEKQTAITDSESLRKQLHVYEKSLSQLKKELEVSSTAFTQSKALITKINEKETQLATLKGKLQASDNRNQFLTDQLKKTAATRSAEARIRDLQDLIKKHEADNNRLRNELQNVERRLDAESAKKSNVAKILRGTAQLVQPIAQSVGPSSLPRTIFTCIDCYVKGLQCDNLTWCQNCKDASEACFRWQCSLYKYQGRCEPACGLIHDENGWLMTQQVIPQW